MGDRITTQLGPPTPDDTRAEVRQYLEDSGNADLVEILGLDQPTGPQCDKDGRRLCPACKLPLQPGRGGCRRAACSIGPKARGVSR